jgi:Cu(I)/Ag(I) efflux system membrane fusion protein
MNKPLLALGGAVLVAAGLAGGYWLALHRMADHDHAATPAPAAATAERKPLYWHDPMYPQQKFDKPGKSPFMDMDLVPVYADEGSTESSVAISPRVQQNLGVRTAAVEEGSLQSRITAVGAVAFDDRDVAIVQARVNGFVERLFARAPLDPVSKGQPLVEILAPEWVAAQEEYLALRRSPLADAALRQAARRRLVLVGMTEETIAALEADGRTRARITLTSPISGVIAELGAREGMTVMPGATLFRINGIGHVWINAEIPETTSGSLRPGTRVEATVPAYPGEKFRGTVSAILPEVNPATRTVKARIEIANPGGKLKPGMYATVDFAPQDRRQALLVPSEAVIRTGKRNVVVVAVPAQEGGQRFRTVEVATGPEAGGKTEITSGLAAGDRVVVSGQFLIDSEASLKATESRLAPEPEAAAPAHVHPTPTGAPR